MALQATLFEQQVANRLRELLREKRMDAGLSQRGLAQQLGQAHSFVNKVEKGVQRLDVLQFVRWCQCCDVSPDDVMRLAISYEKFNE